MSTVGAAHTRRRHSSRRRTPAPPAESVLSIGLTHATDCVLIAMLIVVPACFAGRTPLGQLVFVSFAVALALLWSLRQLVALTPVWRSTASIWLWGAGAALACVQLVPLSQAWIDRLSPEISRLLILWTPDAPGILPKGWSTLSLNPAETNSGLATYLAYALLFVVVVQRIRHRDDVAWMLKSIVFIGSGMAVFGLLQYFLSNGLFFWVYLHPSVSTSETVLGTFTNRNHLAQFLALAIGPTLWWMSQVAKPKVEEKSFGFNAATSKSQLLPLVLLSSGLGAMLLAAILTLSRAGTVAVAVSSLLGLILLSRRGHLPGKIVPTVLLIGTVVGGAALATNFHSLADRFDHMVPDERTLIWEANVRLAARFPWFGTGVGTHHYTHQLETDRPDKNRIFTHAESGYLQVASECGILGLMLALLMIAVCLNWCRKAYRAEAGPESSAMAAAIFASLAANLLHAGVDFFWYAPGCMVVVTVLAACACRLSQLSHAAAGVAEPVRQPPRWAWGASVIGVTALASWMISVKLPAAIAEPHMVEFLNILRHGDDLADTPADLEKLKMTEIVAAARANPQDCHAQLLAAAAYLQAFDRKQQAGENPLSLDQLRDAALASEFSSAQELNEWLAAVVGSNRNYLKAAQHYARRALLNCPLEGQAYIYLSQLDFLRDPRGRLEDPLRKQALTVRPYDAKIDFEIGHAASWKNDVETALHFWRKAFQRSPVYRREIAAALALNYPAAELLEELQPDREGLYALVAAYAAVDNEDDLRLVRHRYAQACLEEAPRLTGSAAEYAWTEALRMYCEGEEPELAMQTAHEALEHLSQSLELHKTLGKLLLEQDDYAGAAKHLHWASLRAPDDAGLKHLAEQAVKEKIRHQRTAEGVTPAGHRLLR